MDHHGQRAIGAPAPSLQRGLGICLIVAGLLIAQILLTRAHAIDPATEELQRIAVLCATEPGSARFDQAWTAWVRKHPEADLEVTIQTVVSRARTLRSMSLSGLEPTPPRRQPSRAVIEDHMRALATSARRFATTPPASTRSATATATPR